MTPLALRIAAHLEQAFHDSGYVLVGGSFEEAGLDRGAPETVGALRELVTAGFLVDEVRIRCADGHWISSGPEVTKPSAPFTCDECEEVSWGHGAGLESDEVDERLSFYLTPATIARLDGEVPLSPAVYARGLQAAEGCREIERLVQGLALVLGLVRR